MNPFKERAVQPGNRAWTILSEDAPSRQYPDQEICTIIGFDEHLVIVETAGGWRWTVSRSCIDPGIFVQVGNQWLPEDHPEALRKIGEILKEIEAQSQEDLRADLAKYLRRVLKRNEAASA